MAVPPTGSGMISGRMAAGGNVYDKYGTQNPIERRLVAGFLGRARRARGAIGRPRGARGGLRRGRALRSGSPARGSRCGAPTPRPRSSPRRGGGRGGRRLEIDFRAAPVQSLDPSYDAAELIVCCEVLEHLADPVAALDRLATLARPWLLVSVPREPLWRASTSPGCKYVGELGNTPGHLGHWSKRQFVDFLTQRVEVVEVRSPLPWTMALCRADRR